MKAKVSCLVILTIILPGCHPRSDQTGSGLPPVTVIISSAEEINSRKEISLSGNVEGFKTVRLGFLVAGKIDFIATEEGGHVFKNRLLASLDTTSYAIAKELADIQVNQVRDEYDRLKSMHDNKSLSESDFAKISYGLQQAKAQQKLHTKNLSDTKLYSPIDGVLLKKLAEVGEITGVGIPVFVVSDISRLKVSTYIPENELHFASIGERVKVSVSSVNQVLDGRIVEVGSAADPSSRAFLLKVEMNNPGLIIRPGMIAGVVINSDESESVLAIPAGAVSHDFNDQSFVYVADTVKHKAFRRFVVTGKIINDKIEIISGLKDGDPVVTGGQQKLVDGSDIAIHK